MWPHQALSAERVVSVGRGFATRAVHADDVFVCAAAGVGRLGRGRRVPVRGERGDAGCAAPRVRAAALYKPGRRDGTGWQGVGQSIPSQACSGRGASGRGACFPGRVARFWNRLLLADPDRFATELFGDRARSVEHVSCHWEEAYHRWRPAFGLELERVVRSSVEPNPAQLPRLYLANESHSSHQAWIEGALEMAQRAAIRALGEREDVLARVLQRDAGGCVRKHRL